MDSKVVHYFVAPKQINLTCPTISIMEVNGSGGAQFTLESNVLEKYVWLSSEAEGIFTDIVVKSFIQMDDEEEGKASGLYFHQER